IQACYTRMMQPEGSHDFAQQRCPQCGTDNPAGAMFCGNCGAQIRSTAFDRPSGPVHLDHSMHGQGPESTPPAQTPPAQAPPGGSQWQQPGQTQAPQPEWQQPSHSSAPPPQGPGA